MTVPQKIFICFLLSVFLFAGIAALAFTGFFNYYGSIVNEPAEIPMLVAVFLTLFLIIFFCFNLRQNPAHEELEELEAVAEEACLTKFSGADMAPGDITGEIVQLESIGGLSGVSMFKPFTFFQSNPELLQAAGSQEDEVSAEVFYEQDGIHYINSNAFTHDNMEKIDSNFAKLVESVVNKD